MTRSKYYTVFNAVWYQALWFTALLGREQYQWVLPILLLLHFALSPNRKADALVLATCGLIGAAVDNILALQNIYVFPENTGPLAVPLWLIGIWAGFACTLLHSFSFFVERRILGPLVIGALAPFSYLAGSKFGAVNFGVEQPLAMGAIAACWLVMMPVFSIICARIITRLPDLAVSKADNHDIQEREAL